MINHPAARAAFVARHGEPGDKLDKEAWLTAFWYFCDGYEAGRDEADGFWRKAIRRAMLRSQVGELVRRM